MCVCVWGVCVCVCMYLVVCVCVCMHLGISVCVCMHLGVSLCVYVCVWGSVCVYAFGGVSVCGYMRVWGDGAGEGRGVHDSTRAGQAALTAGQSWRRLPAGDLEGVVPGAYPHTHAERLPPGVAEGPAWELDVFTCGETGRGTGAAPQAPRLRPGTRPPRPPPRPAASLSQAAHTFSHATNPVGPANQVLST